MLAAPKAEEFGSQPKPARSEIAAGALLRLFGLMAVLCLVLGPLVGMFLSEGGLPHTLMAVLIFLTAVGLWAYCGHLVFQNERLKKEILNKRKPAPAVLAAPPAAPATPRDTAQFVAEISHALRTPLTALLGMAQLLDRADLSGPPRNHVKVMLEAGRALEMLLDDIVAMTQDTTSDMECDPAQAARAVSRLLQPLAWEKRLKLTVTAAPNLPRIAADPRRVRQALIKLAENGLKYTDNGEVGIRVEPHGSAGVRFVVNDTGLGVADDVRPHLFAAPGEAGRKANAGLGLAVVKHVVERAGGKVGFESHPGQGASFWFTLPAAVHAAAPSDGRKTDTIPSGLRLLVVPDDDAFVAPLSVLLAPSDNRIETARSVADAASRAGRADYDAILVKAGDADTLAAAPGVRAPILAILFKDDRRPHCADEIVPWPCDPGLLFDALARLCVPPDVPAEPTNGAPAIDTATVSALEKSVGAATLIDIFKSYSGTAEQLCAAIDKASREGKWPEAARLARDIAGSASGLGLAAMTATARAFAGEADRGENAPALRSGALAILAEHKRSRAALAELYPDLVA